MSDEHQQEIERMDSLLMGAYLLLASILGGMPIPISLPRKIESSEHIRSAVHRATELLGDEPATPEIRATLRATCRLWLTADDLHTLLHHSFDRARIDCLNLLFATIETNIEVAMEWLDSPGGPQ